MGSSESLEALADRAERVIEARAARAKREYEGADVRFDARGQRIEPEDITLPKWPDPEPLVSAYERAKREDPGLGVLFAEAIYESRLAKPWRAYRVAWTKGPVKLAGNAEPVGAWEFGHTVAMEPEAGRRAALVAAADTRSEEHREAAKLVVQTARDFAEEFGAAEHPSGLTRLLGQGSAESVEAAAKEVLRATSDAFRELDDWLRAKMELPRGGELPTAERLRSKAMLRATAALPQGDRTGVCSRWIERVGLGEPLGRVKDESASAARVRTRGVGCVRVRAGERAMIVGVPFVGAAGAVELASSVTEALAWVLPGGAWTPVMRAGKDRVHAYAAGVLGRALWVNGDFVTREAGVDRGAREPVMIELIHGELLRLRSDAALALLWIDALERRAGFGEVARARLGEATGSKPPPSWVVHRTAWEEARTAGARVLGAVAEARAWATLRERYDADWFRNPRAGEGLRAVMNEWRAAGVEETLRAAGTVTSASDAERPEGASEKPVDWATLVAPLAARVRDAWDGARR